MAQMVLAARNMTSGKHPDSSPELLPLALEAES